MGVSQSSVAVLSPTNQKCFIVERIVASKCDFLPSDNEPVITFGVLGRKGADPENPLTHQGIRVGDLPIAHLTNFVENQNGLTYEFENGITMNFFTRADGDVVYNLKTPTLEVTRSVDPLLRSFYKPIGLSSAEIDKLSGIYRLNKTT